MSQRWIFMCISTNLDCTQTTQQWWSVTARIPAEYAQTPDACKYKRGAPLIITPWHSNGFSGRGRIFTGQDSPQVHNALRPGAAGCRPRLKPIPCTLISGDRVWSHSMNEPIMQRSRIPVLYLLSFTTFCIIAFTCTSLCEAVAD